MKNKPSFDSVSTLDLVLELMHEGKSGFIPSLVEREPISTGELRSTLNRRHRIALGDGLQAWHDWALSKESPLTAAEKDSFADMCGFKKKIDPLFKRIKEKNDPQGS